MVYLDADNDLEPFGIADMNEMEAIGSDSMVNILVQIDRIPGYDSSNGNWTSTRRYNITRDTDTANISSTPIEDLGEINMGDPDSLVSFVNWSIQNYPATHYFLVLWNHGKGHKGTCWDYTDEADFLTIDELEKALDIIQETIGIKPDILGFDGCAMKTLEVDYQLRDGASLMIGSQEDIPGDGWPYDAILRSLKNDPTMSPSDLAFEVVKEYVKFYNLDSNVTLSTSNLTAISSLGTAVNNLAQRLMNNFSAYRSEIFDARTKVESFSDRSYIDLYHFAQLINSSISDPVVQNATSQVMSSLIDTIISEDHASQHPNAHGLSVWFPNVGDKTYNSQKFSYEHLNYSMDTGWDEFLAKAVIPVLISENFASAERADIGSNQTVGFHLKWVQNNSDVTGGALYINKTAAPINGTGWASMNVTSNVVGRLTWGATKVKLGAETWYLPTQNPVHMIFDRVKILDGGVTKALPRVGETSTVWFKAVYEFDDEPFDGTKGTLHLNGSAMTWSATNERWEYACSLEAPGQKTFEVSGVFDSQYGLTAINDILKTKTITWTATPFIQTPTGMALIVESVAVVIIVVILLAKNKRHDQSALGRSSRLKPYFGSP